MARTKRIDTDETPEVRIPHDSYNEQVLLAAMINDVEARAHILSQTRASLFLGDKHAAIFEAIAEAHRKGQAFDAQTLRHIGGSDVDPRYVDQIVGVHPKAPPTLASHLEALKWDAARVRAVEGPLAALHTALQDPRADPQRVLALARQVPAALTGHGQRQFMYDPNVLVSQTITDLRRRATGQAVYQYGIPGLDNYDDGTPRMTPGTKPGEITVVTAVSGSGKSTALARMALGMAKQKRRILFGAWEMKAHLTLEIIAAMSLGWPRRKLITGSVDGAEIQQLEDEMRRLARFIKFWKFPWGRDQGARPRSNDEMLDKIHGYIADSGCEVAIFDLLHRAFVDRRIDAEELALERIQVIADETQVHLMAAHQQRLKDIEKRDNKRPTREGMKGTSSWVDVADTIIGVHLPALWKPIPNDSIELLVLKQRNGKWPQAIQFDWDPDFASMTNPRNVDLSLGNDDRKGAVAEYLAVE